MLLVLVVALLPVLASTTVGSATTTYRQDPVGRVLAVGQGSTTQYAAHDGLGSVTDLVSSAGVSARAFDYTPFGGARTPVSAPASPTGPDSALRFTGALQAGSGYWMHARTYDPAAGRFTGVDPLGVQAGRGFDTAYGYVRNRPVMAVDPLGLCDVNPFSASPTACGVYDAIARTLSGANDDNVAANIVSQRAKVLVNVGRGATAGAADSIANGFSSGASCTIDGTGWDARLAQGAGFLGTAILTGGTTTETTAGGAAAAEAGAAPAAAESVGGGVVTYSPQFASRSLLSQVGDGYAVTPGGRTISAHAAKRIVSGGPGRSPTTLARVDEILDNPTALRYDAVRDTVRVSHGKDFVVISGTGPGQHIVTVMVR